VQEIERWQVVEQKPDAGAQQTEAPRRQARAHRILDAAASLILRWGYNKTTIDDIARQAEVAKGTIYLHWKTREELFRALMKREKLAMSEDLKRRLATDPSASTLRGMVRCSALGLMERPLLKAIFLCDTEILGKLARSEHRDAAYVDNLAGFRTYLEFLRENGLVRTDLSLDAQVYVLGAVLMGFFVVGPLMPDGFALTDDVLANLMAETIHRTLEPDRPVSADELGAVSNSFLKYMNRATAAVEEQLGRQMGS
jgi:AcrR family transcriptional regulator